MSDGSVCGPLSVTVKQRVILAVLKGGLGCQMGLFVVGLTGQGVQVTQVVVRLR